jgi:hypothetical protein
MLRRAANALNKATSPMFVRKDSSDNGTLSSSSNTTPGPTAEEKAIDALFDTFLLDSSLKNNPTARLEPESVGKFIEACGITDPETDITALIIMYKCKAQSMYSLTRLEFRNIFLDLETTTTNGLKYRLPDIVQELVDDSTADEFRPFYKWVFAAAREGQQKIISKDLAIGLWTVVLTRGDRKRSIFLDSFIKWLKSQEKVTQITADQWGSFLDFNMRMKPDFSNLDNEAGWLPTLLEQFAISAKASLSATATTTGTRSSPNGKTDDDS